MKRRNHGFTLIEVLLAVAIGAILLTTAFSSLDTALATRSAVADHSTPYAVGPAILDVLEADLRNAHFYDMKENDAFWGVDADLLGREADALSFVTASLCKVGEPELVSTVVPGREEKVERRSPMTEVQYVCRRSPDGGGAIELWRREDFYVDDAIHDGGIYRLVYDRVHELKLEYVRRDSAPSGGFGGERNIDGMRQDGWNAIEERGLPRAVVATLSIYARESEEQAALRSEPAVFVFRRWIPLPQVHESPKAERNVASYDGRLSERSAVTGSGAANRARRDRAGGGRDGGRGGAGGGRGGANGGTSGADAFRSALQNRGNRGGGGAGGFADLFKPK